MSKLVFTLGTISFVFVILHVGGFASATKEGLKALERLNTLLLHQSALDCEDIGEASRAKGLEPLSGAYYFYQYASYIYCKFESNGPRTQDGFSSWTVLLRKFSRNSDKRFFLFNDDISVNRSEGNFEREFRMGARVLRKMLSGSNGDRAYEIAFETGDTKTKETSRVVFNFVYFNETNLIFGQLPKETLMDNFIDVGSYKNRLVSPKTVKEMTFPWRGSISYQIMVKPLSKRH
ncbi:uncharacterized protein LOC143024858 [Oratosquilla oratoria]|uniref:uncharacterized protein LOC143024858 n=1 Tax=Oratosquilla oratoria TaxID=337810 RepID=UPI003F767E64